MKKLNVFLTSGLLLFGSLLMAKESPSVAEDKNQSLLEVVPKETGIFDLIYRTNSKGNYQVNIYNASGTRIFTETIRTEKSFKKAYNFKELKAGDYTVEIIGRDQKLQKKVVHQPTNKVKVDLQSIESSKWNLQVTGVEKSPVHVIIRDNVGHLVFEDSVNIGGGFSRVYDLSKISANSLQMVVLYENQYFSQTLTK